jgi:hypothetical protein
MVIKNNNRFSIYKLALFTVFFAVVGGVVIWKSFANTPSQSYGDLNNDGKVDILDLSMLLSNYGSNNTAEDINSDSLVNIFDLSILLSHYGSSVPVTVPPAPPPPPNNPQPTGISGNWTLKFDDEFDVNSLDLNKWSNCWFSPSCGTQNNVKTDPSNVSVSGGNLILTLSSSSSGASISSNPNGGAKMGYQFQYGVIEARIYFPGDGSNCYNWPAWWTAGQSWPANGENDIAEVLGGDMTVNYHSSSGAHNQGAVTGYWCGGFHTYTLYRQAGKADVYFDGVKVKSYTTDDNGALQYMIINVGSSDSHPAFGTASQVKVDYVRAWQ